MYQRCQKTPGCFEKSPFVDDEGPRKIAKMTPAQKDFATLVIPDGELLTTIKQVLDMMAARGMDIKPDWYRWVERMQKLQAGEKSHYIGQLSDEEIKELAF